MHEPTVVPARSPVTATDVGRPLGAKVMDTRPLPVGPPISLQLGTFAVAPASASFAADCGSFVPVAAAFGVALVGVPVEGGRAATGAGAVGRAGAPVAVAAE